MPANLLGPLQNRLCWVPPDQILMPQECGGYPLNVGDMAWQLEFFSQIAGKS